MESVYEEINMEEKLYTFEEASLVMNNAGLGRVKRSDDLAGKYRQFAENGSSLHVKTARGKNYILYCTIKDFGNITYAAKEQNKNYVMIKSVKKDEIKREIEQVRARDAIILIANGNRVLHNSAENYIPNEVIVYSNENFEFLVDVLSRNEINRETRCSM